MAFASAAAGSSIVAGRVEQLLEIARRPEGCAYRSLDAVLVGDSAVADEGYGDADEPKEVVCQTLVTAMQTAEAIQPSHGPFDHPAVPAESLRGLDTFARDTRRDAPFS